MKDGWIRNEKGWYTKEEVGGVCKEKTGWFFYPKDSNENVGPFKTLKQLQNKLKVY